MILQLVMALEVELPGEEVKVMEALIDTGAEIKLIRKNCNPDMLWSKASNKINLITANGQKLLGGPYTGDISMQF